MSQKLSLIPFLRIVMLLVAILWRKKGNAICYHRLYETEDSYLKQIEKNVDEVNKILKHMGLSSDGNVSEIRRLGRSHNAANKEKRACRLCS